MDKKRKLLRTVSASCVFLLMLGTLLSFFFAPRIADAKTRKELGLPEDAFVTDTARSPWVYLDENGCATLYGDRMGEISTLRIPEAVNGIALKKVLLNYTPSQWVESIILPKTLEVKAPVTYIRDWQHLKTLVFSEGIEDLSGQNLWNLPSLSEIYLPRSLKYLCSNFASSCDASVAIFYAGTEEEWLALGDVAKRILKRHPVVFETPVPVFDAK